MIKSSLAILQQLFVLSRTAIQTASSLLSMFKIHFFLESFILSLFCSTEGVAKIIFGEDLTVERINDKCLTCLCFAASECSSDVKCDSDVCGVFAIGYQYWIDAGYPTLMFDEPDADGAYIRCVSDLYCAAKTVANYMRKFPYDCNADGKIDCWDYAGIHNRGMVRCADYWDIDFENNYGSCIKNKTMMIKFDID